MWWLAGCAPDADDPAGPHVVRVLVLNVELGGEVVDFATIPAAVSAADADIVLVNEAVHATERLADAVGFSGVDLRTDVIARLPVLAPPDGDGRWAWVELAPGEGIAVGHAHLPSTPYGPFLVERGASLARVLENEQIVRVPALRPHLDDLAPLVAAGAPVLLGGDFNSPSHLDWTEAAVGARPHVRGPVAWPVTVEAEAAGLVDVFRAVHPDPVAVPGLTWWAGRPPDAFGQPDPAAPQDRIDLLFAAGPVEPVDAGVVGEQGADGVDVALAAWGTDHRGVLAVLEVEPAPLPPLVTIARRRVEPGDPVVIRWHGAGDERLEAAPIGGPAIAAADLGVPDGIHPFDTAGWPLGAYEARLVRGDEVLSAYPFVVTADVDAVTVAADAAAYAPGAPIGAQWSGPGHRWDWIGLFASPADPARDPPRAYVYTGSEVEGAAAFDAETVPGWPLRPGRYELHYLLDDSDVSAARSAPFAVE